MIQVRGNQRFGVMANIHCGWVKIGCLWIVRKAQEGAKLLSAFINCRRYVIDGHKYTYITLGIGVTAETSTGVSAAAGMRVSVGMLVDATGAIGIEAGARVTPGGT
jgi:hypothetical protein